MSQAEEQRILRTFGGRIAELRAVRSLTQEQLAEKAGMDRMTIAFIEGGRRWPRPATINTLARTLGVRIEELFKGL